MDFLMYKAEIANSDARAIEVLVQKQLLTEYQEADAIEFK